MTEGEEGVVVCLDVRLDVLDGLCCKLDAGLLLFVPRGCLDCTLRLERGDNVLVTPAELVSDTANGAVLTVWTELGDSKCGWDNKLLFLIVWRWASVECLQLVHCELASASLVWNHASDCTPQHFGWTTEVELALERIRQVLLSEEGHELHC